MDTYEILSRQAQQMVTFNCEAMDADMLLAIVAKDGIALASAKYRQTASDNLTNQINIMVQILEMAVKDATGNDITVQFVDDEGHVVATS